MKSVIGKASTQPGPTCAFGLQPLPAEFGVVLRQRVQKLVAAGAWSAGEGFGREPLQFRTH